MEQQGQSGTAGAGTTATPATGATDRQNAGSTGASTGTGQQTGQEAERRFSQADIDRAIEARLARERKQAEEKAMREREQAEAERLKQQGEFQELARQHEQRANGLAAQVETLQAGRDELAKALTKRIKAEVKEWPQEAKDLLADDEDPLAFAASVERARPLVQRLADMAGTQPARVAGAAPGPKPAGVKGPQEAAEAVVNGTRAGGRYTPF